LYVYVLVGYEPNRQAFPALALDFDVSLYEDIHLFVVSESFAV
jgi:hypothetical protein